MTRFEWIVDPGAGHTKPDYDVPIFETESFVVLPSLGSLVPGWLLAVPRRRMPNLRSTTREESRELKELLVQIRARLGIFPGRLHEFEHGGSFGSEIACGIDQAHLHIVPLSIDLYDLAMRQTDVSWIQAKSEDTLWDAGPDGEYLTIRAQDNSFAMGLPDTSKSQWFRRLIASHTGKSNQWNYRDFPQFPIMEKTHSIMGTQA